jgi:hypothetical protein
LDISTDWTLVLQKEVSAQEDLVHHLNIPLSLPVSPPPTRTTTTTTTPTPAEQESTLAKSQLGFIDMFAEPLWNIGAELFFPGMQFGLHQIQANRAVWMSKIQHQQQQQGRPVMDEATSSGSTMTGTTKSDTVTMTTSTPDDGGIRKVASSAELNGNGGKATRMRKERSFSSLMFWKKRGRQAVLGEQ